MNKLNEYLSRIMETRKTILNEISTINLKQVSFDFSVDEEYNINELIIYLITNDNLMQLQILIKELLNQM